MAQVSVNINGKTYRMACEDGQEQHLTGLAAGLNAAIDRLKTEFGEIGDQRLTVMAAITMADQGAEAQKRLRQMESDLARLAEERDALVEERDRQAADAAKAVETAAEQIEQAASRILRHGARS